MTGRSPPGPAAPSADGTYRPSADPSTGDEIDLRSLWATIRRRRGTVVLTLALVLAGVTAYTLWVTPVWSAKTLIRVDEQESGLLMPSALEMLTSLGGGGEIDTEMRILQTRPIAEQVVAELNLNVVVTGPRDLPRELFFQSLDLGRQSIEGKYRISSIHGGRYVLQSADEDTPDFRAEVSAGEPVELPSGVLLFTDFERGADRDGDPLPTELEFETLLFQEAVEALLEDVSVTRPDRDANVMQVTYRTSDRTLSHEVPNALATAFLARRIREQKADALSTVSLLQEQVEETRARLEAVEADLQDFREGAQIVALGAEAEALIERLATLQTQRTGLDAERAALAKLVADIDAEEGQPDYRRLASFPTFFANDAIAGLLQELIQADRARTELLVRVTPRHPDVVAVDRRIAQLEGQLGAIGRNYLEALSDQIAALDEVFARFGSELEQIPEREIQFARIERQASMLAELFALLQTRLKEAEVTAAIDDSSVRIVEYAIEPLEPKSPRPLINLTLAAVMGLVLGLVLAFVGEYTDSRLRSADRIEELYGLPTMARIPHSLAGDGREARAVALVGDGGGQSATVESFRSLRTNVGFVRGGRGAERILITSPSVGEGKSVTAANLAIALAQSGRATVLVDADMRRPWQHLQFGAGQSPGLSDCLLAGELVDGALNPTNLESLSVLPAGRQSPNPTELLDSPRLDRLLEELRGRFTTVVIDAPPVLAVTDSAVLAPKTDGVILVVRAGKTDKDAIALAIRQMHQVGGEVLGLVVNDARPEGPYGAYFDEYYGEVRPRGLRGLVGRIAGPRT